MNLQNALSWLMYCAILAVGTLSMWWAQKIYKQGSRQYWWFLILTFLILAVPVALRAETVGFDTAEYNEYYYRFLERGDFRFRENLEVGYHLIARIAAFFGHPQIVHIIYAVITFVFMVAGLWYLKDQINLGLAAFFYVCFFYLQTYNVIRQCMAIAIIFFALRFIRERKFWPYLLFIILAYTIHTSALFALLYYPIGAKKLSPKMINLICGIMVAAVVFAMSPLLEPVLKLIVNLPMFSAYEKHVGFNDGTVGLSWLPRAVIIIGAIALSNTFKTEKTVRHVALFGSSVSLPFLAINYISNPIGRLGAYFSIYNIITFASFADRDCEKKFLPKVENVVVAAFALLTFVMSLYSNGLLLVPYSVFFA